ncbi:ATPase WRNIP1-like isoform X2 [Arctopsyche grandis]|uniref:ATPase WRNIP1-like isoform X2 n=1 Tax=Arctopsyche grandis TaxID=121162 RepID=UPI00406D77A7
MNREVTCPVCGRSFSPDVIQQHADRCLFLTSSASPPSNSIAKKIKLDHRPAKSLDFDNHDKPPPAKKPKTENVPLAEQMRPKSLEEYIGQCHVIGDNTLLRQLILKREIPSMIFWGPPGCGKTSLANVISNICKEESNLRFVKLSATMSGVNDVKEVVKVAKNEAKFDRKTILFMDEVHRFNKLQQDTFLPHIESGVIVMIGATTENPSFSLNSALLSRCRVIVLEKLNSDNVMNILLRAVTEKYSADIVDCADEVSSRPSIDRKTLQWLADICDGDARIALNSLQISFQMKQPRTGSSKSVHISLEDIQEGIKRSHLLYDRKGEEHYNIISTMHKSIRASDDNAALYWLTRMLTGGEDPLYIARRLVRLAGEDIGLADPRALQIAVSCMQACQLIGMPECDVVLAECVVYMARAPKSTEVYVALQRCKKNISEHKGALPSVPLPLRNAPTKLMTELGYGRGYNTAHKNKSGLQYMPDGMESVVFF